MHQLTAAQMKVIDVSEDGINVHTQLITMSTLLRTESAQGGDRIFSLAIRANLQL